ncbi:TonB-dependent receptor [Novosphingobium sp. SG720]|uniref:TonB-dependent receptor n=1 Tax=Novosphingobium sp. SG720 TaxID=2586998 RepID=UPI0014451943|nr:TonB-dependent receptor [Novosphingobium sp. SG720]NKJ44137.1 outer membrane receptor protein involved in Fe transport [Novosphingobium sp. SG720]
MIRIHALLAGGALAALAIPTAARAEEPEAPPAFAPGEIVVTGEKAARTLQHTPTSIAVTAADKIARETLLSIQDVYARTANLSDTYGAAGFTIRGITNSGVGGGGQSDTATVYVDGAPVSRQALYGGPTDLWDVQQVEVLRGPQSTIQGLNAMAGGIVITTKDPSLESWTGDARVLWTDRNDRTFSAAVGGPIITDELGLRLSAERRANRGVIRNITRGGYDDAMQSLNLRGKLKWTPAALPGFEATASYNRVRREGGYLYQYARTDVADYYDNRTSTSDQPNRGWVASDIAVVQLGYRLTDHLKLSSATSWNRSDVRSLADSDGTPVNLSAIDNHYRYKTLTQELRLNYEDDRLSGLLGAWYYRRTGALDANSQVNVTTPTGTITSLLTPYVGATAAGTIAAAYAQALPVIPVAYTSYQPERVETMAVFGDARFKVADRLTLIGGFRLDRERNRYAAQTLATFTGTLPDVNFLGTRYAPLVAAVNSGVLGLVDDASSAMASNTRTFHAFLPKAGISMDWTPRLTTAFTVQRAYRSGGSSQNPARATLVPYNPEFSWNYEGSLRSKWFGGKLLINANAFYMTWKNQQVIAYFSDNNYDYNTVNAASSHLYGFEIEASGRLSPAVDLYASVGHTRTRFDDFTLPTGATSSLKLDGTEFPYAPRWTLAAGVNARRGPISGNLNANYRSAVFTGVGQSQASSRVGGRTVVNGQIGYQADHWNLFVFARNLLNAKYRQYNYTAAGLAILGDPQTFGVGAGLHW